MPILSSVKYDALDFTTPDCQESIHLNPLTKRIKCENRLTGVIPGYATNNRTDKNNVGNKTEWVVT